MRQLQGKQCTPGKAASAQEALPRLGCDNGCWESGELGQRSGLARAAVPPPLSVTTRDGCPQAAGEGVRPVRPLLLFPTPPSPYYNVLFIEVPPPKKRERLAREMIEVPGSLTEERA